MHEATARGLLDALWFGLRSLRGEEVGPAPAVTKEGPDAEGLQLLLVASAQQARRAGATAGERRALRDFLFQRSFFEGGGRVFGKRDHLVGDAQKQVFWKP